MTSSPRNQRQDVALNIITFLALAGQSSANIMFETHENIIFGLVVIITATALHAELTVDRHCG